MPRRPLSGRRLSRRCALFRPAVRQPSSTHRWGREARAALDEARERVATCLGARPDEVCFTSGGTEGDNLAILGAWRTPAKIGRQRRRHDTHRAQGDPRRGAPGRGTKAPRSACSTSMRNGVVDVSSRSMSWSRRRRGLLSHVGQQRSRDHSGPAGACGQGEGMRRRDAHAMPCRRSAKFRSTRATQAFDLLSISGHKIGAPKGIGALFIRRGTTLEPLMHGGTQDRGRRPGTENVAYAVGLATAAEMTLAEHDDGIKAAGRFARPARGGDPRCEFPMRSFTGAVHRARRTSQCLCARHRQRVAADGARPQGHCSSGGSACQSGSISPSHVLLAMGVRPGSRIRRRSA